MKFYYGLAPALIGVSIALVQTQVAVALSSESKATLTTDEGTETRSKVFHTHAKSSVHKPQPSRSHISSDLPQQEHT